MVQYNPKYVRGAPGVSERLLALDSGLRSGRMSFVTTGFASGHSTTTANGGSWRCIRQGSAPWVAGDTWKTYGSAASGADTTGWRYGKLPFPSTLCVSLLIQGTTAGCSVQFMAKGLDQFGRPMTETTPVIPIYRQDLTLAGAPTVQPDFHTARFFMARVFSEVNTFSYRVYGTAPTALEVNVGQHFLFNAQLASTVVAPSPTHIEQFYFPANVGIGVGRLLAQERGVPSSRYPEIRVTAWDGQQGPDHMVQFLPHTTPSTPSTPGGILMGFTPRSEWVPGSGVTTDQDVNVQLAGGGCLYSQFDQDPFKFRVDHSPATLAGTYPFTGANPVAAIDGTTFSLYTSVTLGTDKFNNPKTLHWNVEVFTQLGALSPRMDVSARVNS